MAGPRSRQKSKVNLTTSQQEWWKEDKKESEDMLQRKKKINKPGGTQVDYAKKSGQKITAKKMKNRSLKQLNC